MVCMARLSASQGDGRKLSQRKWCSDLMASPDDNVSCGESSVLSTVEEQPMTGGSALVCEQRWTWNILIR